MNKIKEFYNEQFGELRVNDFNGNIYFFLGEVCMYLGYTKVAKGHTYLRKDKIVNICQSLEIKGLSPSDNLENVTLESDFDNIRISEYSLYDLILESRAKNARKFRLWITQEVLPTIRKTGGYVEENRESEFIDKYFPSFSEKTKLTMVQDLQKQNKELKSKNEELIKLNESLKPKAEEFDHFINTDGTFSMNQTAIELKTKRNTLMRFLREKNILNMDNSPSSYYARNGYFEVKNHTLAVKGGEKVRIAITRVTSKGQDFLYRYLKKHIDEYSNFDYYFKNKIACNE